MNRPLLLLPLLSCAPLLLAQTASTAPATPPPSAPPAVTAPLPAQRVYAPAVETLISREAADGVLAAFRKAFVTDAAPRIVVYVNRSLVDTTDGLKLTERVEHFEQTNESRKTSGTQTFRPADAAAPAPALADQQTVREIERLVGRAFRHAGAQLADQKVAASLLPATGDHLVGAAAARDRQALASVADIAIEVLISSRNITVPEVSGDITYPVPDIQATAIRLKDAAILGQAAASDLLGHGSQAGRLARQFSVQDITEATAIALMDDMLTGRK